MNKGMKLGLTGLLLAAALTATGCAAPQKRLQDVNGATRDAVLMQTDYTQDLVRSAACETSLPEDYKGLTGAVKQYFTNLVDSGAKVCDVTGGVSAKEHNEALTSIIEHVYANKNLGCGVKGLENGAILSQNVPMEYKLRAAMNMNNSQGPYMPVLLNEVRVCADSDGINRNLAVANNGDRTSYTLWAIGLGARLLQGSDGSNVIIQDKPVAGSGNANDMFINTTTNGGLL